MSEDTKSDNALGSKNEGVDRMLQMFVELADQGVVKPGITLNVGGCLVSGRMIGLEKYMEMLFSDFAGGFRAGGLPEVADSMEETVREAFRKDREADRAVRSPDPGYIHLEDARFFFGDEILPSSRGVLWRGRLSAVDGFALGVMNVG